MRHQAAALLLGFMSLVAASCGSATISGDASMFAAANIAEDAALADGSLTIAPTPVPNEPEVPAEPELPPEAADDGEPIAGNVAAAEALGLIDVCSFYDEPDRLSEVLGEFWTLGPGIPADGQCLWVSTKTSATNSVVSIELAATRSRDDSGSVIVSHSGPGLSIVVDGNEFRINVVTNNADPTLAVLNLEEAERRIADDIYERATGSTRPAS